MYLFFSAGLDVAKINSLYQNMKDDAIYIESPPTWITNKLGSNIAAKYEYVFETHNNQTYKVLYMNTEAVQYGIPYYEYSFVKIKDEIVAGMYATPNNTELIASKQFAPLTNLDIPDFNNKMLNRNYDKSFIIHITDDYSFSKPDYLVVEPSEDLDDRFDIADADISTVSASFANGRQIKQIYKDLFAWSIGLVYFICCIPLFFLITVFINFISLNIQKNYRYYKINQIFFLSKRTMFLKNLRRYAVCSLLATVLSVIVSEIIFRAKLSDVLFIFSITLLCEAVCIFMACKVGVNRFFKNKIENEEIK